MSKICILLRLNRNVPVCFVARRLCSYGYTALLAPRIQTHSCSTILKEYVCTGPKKAIPKPQTPNSYLA